MNYFNIKSWILSIIIVLSFNACGGSSGSGSNDNDDGSGGYSLVKHQVGNYVHNHEYNNIGQMVKIIYHDGDIRTYKYNTNNKVISSKLIKPSGNVYNRLFVYSNAGQLVKQVEGNGDIYIYEYDDNGNLILRSKKTINGNIPVSTYSYNSLNKRIKVVYSDKVKTISHNTLGQVSKIETAYKDGRITSTTYIYDSVGKIMHGVSHNGDIRIYTYKNKSCINMGSITTAPTFVSALCKK